MNPDAFARLLTDYCLEAQPGQQVVVTSTTLAERTSPLKAWKANFGSGYELLSNGALFSLGALVAFHHEAHGWGVTLLALLPLLVAYEGYRRYMHARDREDAADEERRAA